jgi:hypothetical protein
VVNSQPLTEVQVTKQQKIAQNMKKFDKRHSLDARQLLGQSTLVERKTAKEIVDKGRLFANYSPSCHSDIGGHGRGDTQDERELRQLLKWTGSLFLNSKYKGGIRRCSCKATGEQCKPCEPFWKPIFKQEQRKTPLCGEGCQFCHDPRCFPDDEWVKLHVHRTPAARKRAAKQQKNLKVQ